MLVLCPACLNCQSPECFVRAAGYEERSIFANPPIGLCSDNYFSQDIDRVVGESAV